MRRKLFTVSLRSDGTFALNVTLPDFFNGGIWYYICFGQAAYGQYLTGVPNCQ